MQMEWNLTLNPIFSEVFGTQGFSNPKHCTGDCNDPQRKILKSKVPLKIKNWTALVSYGGQASIYQTNIGCNPSHVIKGFCD
jgi:hypothetical protein